MIYAAIAGALVVGLSLGVFGSGGSILTIPVLIYLLGHEDKIAIAESLGIVGAVALASALPYARAGLVDWRTAVLFGLPGMAGTWLGAQIASFVPGVVQLFVFAGVMLLAGRQMWRRAHPPALDPRPAGADAPSASGPAEPAIRRAAVRIGTDGLAVGVLTGFVGVGGGFLIVPALVLLGGLEMRRAVATSLLVIAMNAATGFWKYLHVLDARGEAPNWRTVGIFILVGTIGSLAGRAVNARIDQSKLQRGFSIFLAIMAAFIVVRESLGLVPPAPAGPPPAAVPSETHAAPTRRAP